MAHPSGLTDPNLPRGASLIAAARQTLRLGAILGGTMPYTPSDYWQELHRRDDLSAVGQSALPAGINGWLYRTLARNYGSFIRRHHLDRPVPARVYDVGAGTGFWIGWWRARGATRVDGCDLVPEVADRLNERFGTEGGVIAAADIADPGGLGSETYDLVSCQNVLLHVTDDAHFERALRNVASLVSPGGVLVLTEPILLHPELERPYDPEKHSRARRLAAYQAPLEGAGLRLEALEAATVIGNNPIEAGSPASYQRFVRWWRMVARRSKEQPRVVPWLGRLIYYADPWALRTGAAPSSKFALFRRPEGGADATQAGQRHG
jgi:SAM-dependent methyltransferase